MTTLLPYSVTIRKTRLGYYAVHAVCTIYGFTTLACFSGPNAFDQACARAYVARAKVNKQ